MKRFVDVFGPALTVSSLFLLIPGMVLLVIPGWWWIIGALLMAPLVIAIVGLLGYAFVQLWKECLEEWREDSGNEW